MPGAPPPIRFSAFEMLGHAGHTRLLKTGCPHLDAFLGGGIDTNGITEIAGEAGAGKTQLALQLTLQAQLPPAEGGLGGAAVYLYGGTANVEPALRRLHQLADAFAKRHWRVQADCELLKNNVYVLQIEDPDDLWRTVSERVPALLGQHSVRLLVIDSIGGVYRGQDEESAQSARTMHGQRAQQLLRLAAKLKELAHKFDIATVVLNQVVDKPSDGQNRRTAAPWELGACGTPDGSMRVPALGLAWSSCVNTRLVLTRRAASALIPESGAGAPYDSMWRRHLHVAFSPRLPMGAEAPFWVREEGVVGAVAA